MKKRGSHGSPKSTERFGGLDAMGGKGGAPGGLRVGPGSMQGRVQNRVRVTDADGNGAARTKPAGMKTWNQE